MKFIIGFIISFVCLLGLYFASTEYFTIKNKVHQLHQQLSEYDIPAQEARTLRAQLESLENKLFLKEQEELIFTVRVAGDMMFDRGVKSRVKTIGQGSYDFIFEKIKENLQEVDFVFANLEGSISDVGADTGKPYSFRFEPELAPALSRAGIDLVSLANNHMLDWGRESLCATLNHLKKSEVASVGAGCNREESENPYILHLGNTQIAFLAYTEFYKGAHATETRSGMSEYDMTKIKKRVQQLKENVDLVFVSMHWGEEYKTRAVERQVSIGKELVDAGVDVVIGHHPHVAQEIERYGDGWIIYSLGNFVFDQSWSEETMKGLMADIKIKNKQVFDIKPIPTRINNNFQPYILD